MNRSPNIPAFEQEGVVLWLKDARSGRPEEFTSTAATLCSIRGLHALGGLGGSAPI